MRVPRQGGCPNPRQHYGFVVTAVGLQRLQRPTPQLQQRARADIPWGQTQTVSHMLVSEEAGEDTVKKEKCKPYQQERQQSSYT